MRIEVKDLCFSYGNKRILDGVNVTFDEPGLYCIVGPNGVGKSTLVKCILGIYKIESGSILLDGHDLSEFTPKDLAQVIGFVPVTSSDIFSMSVLDTVMMGRYPHQKMGMPSEFDWKIVKRALNMMNVRHLALSDMDELSAGQLQKVVLAKGIAQQPRVLLLDEPTSNLDIKHQVNVTRLLKTVSEERKMMVIMICHDLNIAAKYSDSIIIMHDGGIYSVGAPSDVITPENIETVYGVKCKVIDDLGKPHIILRDDLETC